MDGVRFGANSVHHVRQDQLITLGVLRTGLRSYLGVRGGWPSSRSSGPAASTRCRASARHRCGPAICFR